MGKVGYMNGDIGWLAKIAAFPPTAIMALCVLSVLVESGNPAADGSLGGALKKLFALVLGREFVAVVLVVALLHANIYYWIDKELRRAPKCRFAVVGNSIVLLIALAALLMEVRSLWVWSVMLLGGVVTSIIFRRRFGDHLLL